MRIHCLKNLRTSQLAGLILVIALGLMLTSGFTVAQAAETVSLPPQAVAPGKATLTVNLELAPGLKFNQEAPSTFGITSGDSKVVALTRQCAKNLPVAKLPLNLTLPVKAGKTTLQATFRLNFCDEKQGFCLLKEVVLTLPVEISNTSTNKKLEMAYTVTAN